ncbi:hypothetical protein F4777DRAFT_159774 [Nemania sp. FL0916]|nr:hypothetical protein F4777DRAFT_159774 [Nemania sp. FL0916]
MGSLTKDTPHYPDASDASLVLTHPTPIEKDQTWRLNHSEWGGPLDMAAYIQREIFLATTPFAAGGGMTHWILTERSYSSTDHESEANWKQQRHVLASCETLRKRVLYALPIGDGTTRDGIAYGIGSVYTYPEFRGRRYAARMLKELGTRLRNWPSDEVLSAEREERDQKQYQFAPVMREAVCSALWSDIGKQFYGSKGWPAFASTHIEFRCSNNTASATATANVSDAIATVSLSDASATDDSDATILASETPESHKTEKERPPYKLYPVTSHNLAQLCREDEQQLRRAVSLRARATGRVAMAFAPEEDVFRWHWAREDFIAPRLGRNFDFRENDRRTDVRGVVVSVPAIPTTTVHGGSSSSSSSRRDSSPDERKPGTRMWAIWTRVYASSSDVSKNILHILRLAFTDTAPDPDTDTDPDVDDVEEMEETESGYCYSQGQGQCHSRAFAAIIRTALGYARRDHCGSVQLWNPSAEVRALAAASGLQHSFIEREDESIPSMMWYGPPTGMYDKPRRGKGAEGEDAVEWLANEKYCWC